MSKVKPKKCLCGRSIFGHGPVCMQSIGKGSKGKINPRPPSKRSKFMDTCKFPE